MINNLPKSNTQHQSFKVDINVNFNNGTATTAFFVVLGICCCMYITAKYNYTTTMNHNNDSLSIGPATMAVEA